jgi:hypothetical protein
MMTLQILPARGEGDQPQAGGGGLPQMLRSWRSPSTMLRMVAFPVPGRI